MPRRLVIVGAGGWAREIAWLVDTINRTRPVVEWEIVGFLLDRQYELEPVPYDYPVFRGIDEYAAWDSTEAICGIGDPGPRRSVVERLSAKGVRWATIAAPTSSFDRAKVGAGTILWHQAGASVNVEIGQHVIFHAFAGVGHDCRVGSFVNLGKLAEVGGRSTIEDDVFIGAHVGILPGLRIGRGAKLMMGSIITRDVPPGAVMFGNPAKQLNI